MRRLNFDRDWYVTNESTKQRVGPVTVPHDAMLYEARDPDTGNAHNTGYFPGGIYRYSKTFQAPSDWRDRHVSVEFEGVYHRSTVYVNGQLLGGRPYGYSPFTVDMTSSLVFDAENVIEVVADNSEEPNSRWYTGSGIYRPVHLLVGGPIRLSDNGIRVLETKVDGRNAEITFELHVRNDTSVDRAVTARAQLHDGTGAGVARVDTPLTLPARQLSVHRVSIPVQEPRLWSHTDPYLYDLDVELDDAGTIVDDAGATVGIRTLALDARRGLRVNNQPVKLRGACIHHDNGVIGAIETDAAADRRVRILKEAGYNAIRSAHNPISGALLRACDRRGVYVMNELADSWYRPKATYDYALDFDQWWRADLDAMVIGSMNHPSVIFHSIGNEIGETAQPRGIDLSHQMVARIRATDPTRFITNGVNGFLNLISGKDKKPAEDERAHKDAKRPDGARLIGLLNALMGILEKALPWIMRLPAVDSRTRDAFEPLDAAGYNYAHGRYEKDTRAYPERVIVGTETTSAQVMEYWRRIEDMPNVIGDFVWTAWDYIGEAGFAATQYGTARQLFNPYPALLAATPVIDITGHRQTQSYINEIVWGLRSDPYIAVRPVDHSGQKSTRTGWRPTDALRSWSWGGLEGRSTTVEVYADTPYVELFLNTRSLGRRRSGPDRRFTATYTVPYEPGELVAHAIDATGQVTGVDRLRAARGVLQLTVEPEAEALAADGQDLLYLPIKVSDAAGTVESLADRAITVAVSGAGTLAGLGSADPFSPEGFTAPTHHTYYGRALAVVRAGHATGDVTIRLTADGCEPVTITVPVISPKARRPSPEEAARHEL